jgi:type IV secretion system protein TrbI
MFPDNSNGTEDTISSANSGEALIALRGAPPRVTRISRRALLLAGIFAGLLGLVVLIFGFDDRNAQQRDGLADENAIRPTGPIESVKGLPQDYSFDAAIAPATRPAAASAEDQALAEAMRELAEQRRKLLEQQQKEQQAAYDSPLLFAGVKSSVSSATAGPTAMPTPATPGSDIHSATTMATGGADRSPGALAGSLPGDAVASHQQEKEAFLTQAAAIEPYLSKPLLNPISKYELKAGSIIPSALLTAINTDLPGEVIGQVTENVYDTITGNYLLIPQGSKLLGKYQSLVSNGQNRALIVWQRLIYPNGYSIVLDGMPGTDEAGMAGLQDQVDYHLDKLAEATALSTAIAYAGNLARNPQSTNGYSSSDIIGDAVAQQANRIGEKIIDRELDVQPTITIRQGWPLRVLVNKDMILQPYVP